MIMMMKIVRALINKILRPTVRNCMATVLLILVSLLSKAFQHVMQAFIVSKSGFRSHFIVSIDKWIFAKFKTFSTMTFGQSPCSENNKIVSITKLLGITT